MCSFALVVGLRTSRVASRSPSRTWRLNCALCLGPARKKWIACSVTVLVFVLVMSIVIGALDMGATALVKLMM